MTVDPSTAPFRHTLNETSWYFCSDLCRQQFAEHPDQFLSHQKVDGEAKPRRASLKREALIAVLIFSAALGVTLLLQSKGNAREASATGATVSGTPAGKDQAVDNGAGNVIVTATYERLKSTDRERFFTLSLNTHLADLSSFNSAAQVRLRIGSSDIPPATVERAGERSSHHQNVRLTFPAATSGEATLVAKDLAGIAERRLPFAL